MADGEWLAVYLKGAFMGAADTVPGVSGGTIALVTGIYDRLIAAITALHPRALAHLPRVHTAEGRSALAADLVEMDLPFLVVLGTGVATAVVALSEAIETALRTSPAPMNAFFFGLIAASAVVLYRHVAVDTAGRVAAGVAGLVAALALTSPGLQGTLTGSTALPAVFLSGTVSITAMVLPGISGSFILLVIGQYESLIRVPSAFVGALVTFAGGGPPGPVVELGTVVVVFLLGALLGLLTVARVIRWALERYHEATLVFLVSLMVGALRLPVHNVRTATPAWTTPQVALTLAAAAVGAGLVLGLDRYTDDLEY